VGRGLRGVILRGSWGRQQNEPALVSATDIILSECDTPEAHCPLRESDMPHVLPQFSLSGDEVLLSPLVQESIRRGIIEVRNGRVSYSLAAKRNYDWSDPEEWVRCYTVAFLILEKDYPSHRMKTEVIVPRRTPSDVADIVVYNDDRCREPYLVVENKRANVSTAERRQGIEQLFGNANSLTRLIHRLGDFGLAEVV
jgi:hypothetical protein